MSDNIFVAILLCLVGLIVLQQVTIQKLVNKLMSRNFHEYESAVSLSKQVKEPKVKNDGVPEDLRSLTEFNGGF